MFTDQELRGWDLYNVDRTDFSGADCFHCHGAPHLQISLFIIMVWIMMKVFLI